MAEKLNVAPIIIETDRLDALNSRSDGLEAMLKFNEEHMDLHSVFSNCSEANRLERHSIRVGHVLDDVTEQLNYGTTLTTGIVQDISAVLRWSVNKVKNIGSGRYKIGSK